MIFHVQQALPGWIEDASGGLKDPRSELSQGYGTLRSSFGNSHLYLRNGREMVDGYYSETCL